MNTISIFLKLFSLVILLQFSSHILAAEKLMKDHESVVYEIVKWKSKSGVEDKAMIDSVNAMVGDLKKLKGFLHQSLYKNANNEWVDIYYWKTEKDAHESNASMADKASFKKLIELIEPNSVSIEILHELQSSGSMSFDK